LARRASGPISLAAAIGAVVPREHPEEGGARALSYSGASGKRRFCDCWVGEHGKPKSKDLFSGVVIQLL